MSRTLSAALFLACLMPAAALAADLTRGEIASELVGKQIVWWEAAGWQHGYLMLLPNGAAEMTVDRPRPRRDVGRWSLRGDEVCTRWSALREAQEKCYRIRRDEEGLFATTGGNVFEVRELGV